MADSSSLTPIILYKNKYTYTTYLDMSTSELAGYCHIRIFGTQFHFWRRSDFVSTRSFLRSTRRSLTLPYVAGALLLEVLF